MTQGIQTMKNILDAQNYVRCSVTKTDLGYGLRIALPDGKIKVFPDISEEREATEKMTRMINDGKVSALHIDEIIEDLLG